MLDMVVCSLLKQIKHFDVGKTPRYPKTLLEERFNDHPCQPTAEDKRTTISNGSHVISKMELVLDKHSPKGKIPAVPEVDLETGVDSSSSHVGASSSSSSEVDLETGVDVQVESRLTGKAKVTHKI